MLEKIMRYCGLKVKLMRLVFSGGETLARESITSRETQKLFSCFSTLVF